MTAIIAKINRAIAQFGMNSLTISTAAMKANNIVRPIRTKVKRSSSFEDFDNSSVDFSSLFDESVSSFTAFSTCFKATVSSDGI